MTGSFWGAEESCCSLFPGGRSRQAPLTFLLSRVCGGWTWVKWDVGHVCILSRCHYAGTQQSSLFPEWWVTTTLIKMPHIAPLGDFLSHNEQGSNLQWVASCHISSVWALICKRSIIFLMGSIRPMQWIRLILAQSPKYDWLLCILCYALAFQALLPVYWVVSLWCSVHSRTYFLSDCLIQYWLFAFPKDTFEKLHELKNKVCNSAVG